MPTKINTNQINTNASARFTSDSEMASKANISDIVKTLRITYADLDSGTHTTYTNLVCANQVVLILIENANGLSLYADGQPQTFSGAGVLTFAAPRNSDEVFILTGTGILGDVTQVAGKNKFNPGAVVANHLVANSGSTITGINSSAGWAYIEIQCGANELWTLSQNGSGWGGGIFRNVGFYDNTHTLIGSGLVNWASNAIPASLTTPAGCASFVFNVNSPSATGVDYTKIQIEKGIQTSFEAYSVFITQIGGNYVYNANKDVYSTSETYAKTETYSKQEVSEKAGLRPSVKLIKSSYQLYIRTYWDASNDLIQFVRMFVGVPFDNNPVNFVSVHIIPNTTIDSAVSTTVSSANAIHFNSDSTAPANYNGTFIAGNHGPFFGIEVTQTAHGKTSSDLGSNYTDGAGRNFYIIRIVDADNLIVLSDNQGVGDLWSFKTSVTGSLTYVTGGVNTATIVPSAQVLFQIESVLQSRIDKIFCDKVEVTADGVYVGSEISITTEYNVSDLPAVLAYVIANKVPIYNDPSIAKSSRFTVAISFIGNGSSTLYGTFRNFKEIFLSYYGFYQSEAMFLNGSNRLFRIIPDSLPFVGSIKTWNYALGENITGAIDDFTLLPAYYATTNKPPYRFIEYIDDGSGNKIAGFAFGYSPTSGNTSIANRNNITDTAYITQASGKKNYPYGFDKKLNVSGKLPVNNYFEGYVFRSYFNPTIQPASCPVAIYKDIDGYVAMIDIFASGNFIQIVMPNFLYGKAITLIEKTTNLVLLNSIVQNDGIYISVDTSISPVIAYLVIKIK